MITEKDVYEIVKNEKFPPILEVIKECYRQNTPITTTTAYLKIDKNSKKWAEELSKLPLTQIKFLPSNIVSRTAINIYSDKVAILMWYDPPTAVLIRNKEVADLFKEYFNLLWKIAKGV